MLNFRNEPDQQGAPHHWILTNSSFYINILLENNAVFLRSLSCDPVKPIKLPHWASKTHIFSLALTQNLPTRWCCRTLLAQDKDFRWRTKPPHGFFSARDFWDSSDPPARTKVKEPQSRTCEAWRKKKTPAGDVFIYFFQGLQTFRVHYTFFPESKINILHLKRKTNIKTQSGWVVIRWCKKNKHDNNL